MWVKLLSGISIHRKCAVEGDFNTSPGFLSQIRGESIMLADVCTENLRERGIWPTILPVFCLFVLFLVKHHNFLNFFQYFFCRWFLQYNCFVMLCYSLLYNEVNQLYVYIYTHLIFSNAELGAEMGESQGSKKMEHMKLSLSAFLVHRTFQHVP